MKQSREIINQLKEIVKEKEAIKNEMYHPLKGRNYTNEQRIKALMEYREAVRNHLKALGC